MKLLIIECGNSKLSAAVEHQAKLLNPKPEFVSSMTLDMERVNIPEVKRMLQHLAPDTIVLNPPSIVPDERVFNALVKEIARAVSILNGRLLFISSVEVLGDATTRSEAGVSLPHTEVGTFLLMAETQIESATSRYYILRIPYTTENLAVPEWISWTKSIYGNEWRPNKDTWITLATIEDIAKIVLEKIQTGWFGRYHVTPGDQILLSNLIEAPWNKTGRPIDRSITSRYSWTMKSTKAIWAQLVAECAA